MKPYSYFTILTAALFTVCGCQNELDSEHGIIEGISFNPFIDGVENTEVTKASAFRSEDGSLEIPAWLTVSDGISVLPDMDPASPETRGTQINTGSASTALADFASSIGNTFYVTAWKGTTPERFVPSSGTNTYEAVTYSNSKWSTIKTKWEGTDDNATFFAYANCPSNSSVATVSNNYSNYQTLTYSAVPTDASLQKDILLGYYYGDGTPETTDKICTADLQFHHPLTAVKFKKGYFSGTVKFKAIYLDGVYKNGTAMMIGSGTNSSIAWITSSSTKQEVGQEGDSYLTVVSDIIGDTFLLIPQTITASAPVTVTIVAEIDNVDHPLTATLAPVEWKAGKTYTYTLGYENFVLTVDGEVQTDYKGNGTKTYSVNSSAAWKLQYTTNGGTTWTDAVANTQIGGWIKFDKVSGSGSSSAQTVTATVTAGTSSTLSNEHDAVLQANPAKGTENAPYDLSMHTIYGVERTAGPVTANSYVINAPGWYAFPLVYGNAIDYNKVPSNGVNTQAYDPSDNPSDIEYLTSFIDSEGNAIESPYISGATSAYPYWEDVPSYALIAQTGCTVLSQTDAAAKGLTACNCGYVVFQVNQSTLTQGNAVIAVSNGSHILWSWHIWVTDMDLTCRTVTNSGATFSKGIMPLNLGWVDLTTSTGYERKKLQIRFVQIANGVVKNEVKKNPERKEYVTATPGGQSPTYQWGRKDPFIRFKPDGSELSTSEFSGTGMTISWASGLLQTAIQNPTQFFRSDNGTGNTGWHIGGGKYVNLWSATLKPTGTEGYSAAPVKTIYDPCPPGFQVPQKDAFNLWTGGNGVWNGGYSVKTSASGDEYIFFPAVGYRNGRSIYASATWYTEYLIRKSRYWTVAPNNDGSGKIEAYQFRVDENAMSTDVECDKTYGNSIRPVQETSGKY